VDCHFIAEQPAPAPHLAHLDGCAALRIVLIVLPREVSRHCAREAWPADPCPEAGLSVPGQVYLSRGGPICAKEGPSVPRRSYLSQTDLFVPSRVIAPEAGLFVPTRAHLSRGGPVVGPHLHPRTRVDLTGGSVFRGGCLRSRGGPREFGFEPN